MYLCRSPQYQIDEARAVISIQVASRHSRFYIGGNLDDITHHIQIRKALFVYMHCIFKGASIVDAFLSLLLTLHHE